MLVESIPTARQLSPQFYTEEERTLRFADGYPLLIGSEAALEQLNSKLRHKWNNDLHLNWDRFRPNVVVDGCEAHEEDWWYDLTIGHLPMKACKPCSRCSMPTVNQETGTRDPDQEPTLTLKTYRDHNNTPYFGANAVAVARAGMLHTG